jgi:hypothetical protein
MDAGSGGYLYDRMLVRYLRGIGDEVEVIGIPEKSTAACLFDNLDPRLGGCWTLKPMCCCRTS